jgi:hypothetical protein
MKNYVLKNVFIYPEYSAVTSKILKHKFACKFSGYPLGRKPWQ